MLSLSSPAGLFWLSGAYVNEQNSFVFAGNGQTVDDVEASSMGVLTANFSSDPEVKKKYNLRVKENECCWHTAV